jgi:hypothetical protein
MSPGPDQLDIATACQRSGLGQETAFADELCYGSMSNPMKVVVLIQNRQLISKEDFGRVILEECRQPLSRLDFVAIRRPFQVGLRISEVIPISHADSVYCGELAA